MQGWSVLDCEYPEVLILVLHKVRNQPRVRPPSPILRAAAMSMFIPPTEQGRPNTAENKPRTTP
jgi:hypothetical protein